MKRVTEGQEVVIYTRDRSKTVDSEHSALFRDLVDFANLGKDKLTKRCLGFARPRDSEGAKVFNTDIEDAHDLTRTAFAEMAKHGASLVKRPISRSTEQRIDNYLTGVREKRRYSIGNGNVGVWLAYDIPTAGSYCAYLLASIIGSGLHNVVIQCALRDCKVFAWKPIGRGERPRHCGELHRARDAKRHQRGTA